MSNLIVWINSWHLLSAEVYSESSQTSKMESFAKIIDFFHPLTIFAKSYILDMWLGSECASTVDTKLAQPRLNTSYVQVLVTFNLGCLSTDLANCQVYQRTPVVVLKEKILLIGSKPVVGQICSKLIIQTLERRRWCCCIYSHKLLYFVLWTCLYFPKVT